MSETPLTDQAQTQHQPASSFREDFLEIRRLLAEAYEHYFEHSDGYCKSSEGAIALHYPEYFWRGDDFDASAGPAASPAVEIYSYVFGGGGRSHWFDTVSEALVEVRRWHATQMSTRYCKQCASTVTNGHCWCTDKTTDS